MPLCPERPSRPALATVFIFTGLNLAAPSASALVIEDFDPTAHNRFTSGLTDAPVANTSSSFIGHGLDFSGVGWQAGTGLPGVTRMHNATLLSPMHSLAAAHYPINPGTPMRFLGSDDTLYVNPVSRTNILSNQTYNDVLVITHATPFSSTQTVTPYRVLDVRSNSLAGQTLVIYGDRGDGSGARIGLAQGGGPNNFTSQSWINSLGSAVQWESGDSGSPAFVRYTAPDGSTSLTLAGAAWGPRSFSDLLTRSTDYTPGLKINAILKSGGYALKWTIYDDAGNTAHTAPQWTGAFGSSLGDIGNWSVAGDPAGKSVLFDASATPDATTISVAADTPLRGALFKSAPAGFTFEGSGALTLGLTGLRNEAAATQTFNVPVVLGDSQNWEAVGGDLVFNRSIDTGSGAHLLVVGGARDTTIHGVISGAGSLAKDDPGVLTLTAANTYAGKTWVHGGTLRLGAGGSLPAATELVFQTVSPATFDLGANNQTLAGLQSALGGTGRVRLGGGTLTLALAADNSFAGDIVGDGHVVKNDSRLFVASGLNTYAGTTTLNAGVFRLGSVGALSPSAELVLNGGVLELGAADYAADLGAGPGRVRFAGDGGFSAFGGDRRVTLDGGAALVWGAPGFVASGRQLLLSATTADSALELTNPLVLGTSGSGSRTITVANGAAAVDARLSGAISDGSGVFSLVKSGAGVLELTGGNTYRGQTQISGGALRIGSAGALSSESNLVLSGGVLELGVDDYAAPLGSGPGEVRFTGSGGFSAAGADRFVNLGGAASPLPLTWGSSHFLAAGQSLILSSTGADATLELRNPLVLGASGSGTTTVQVNNGSAKIDARLSGGVSDGAATYSFSKTGAGTLELTGANTWKGSTLIGGGVLRLAPSVALPSGNIVFSGGGVLELTAGNLVRTLGTGPNQISFGAGGGGFSAARSDRIVYLNGGASLTWGETPGFLPATGSLVFSSDSSDATLVFMNGLSLGSSGSGDRTVLVNQGAARVDARITGNITSGEGAFSFRKSGHGTLELTGANTYAGSTWVLQGVLRLGSATALSPNANTVLNGGTLELGGGNLSANLGTGAGQIHLRNNFAFSAAGATRTLTLNGGSTFRWGLDFDATKPLNFSSPDADATLVFSNSISMENSGPALRTVNVLDGSAAVDARLSGVISQSGAFHGITKTGPGTLELTGANTYKGETVIESGTLLINGNHSAATGRVVVEPGATLGGSGIVGGAALVRAGAVLDPGHVSRRLTFNSTLDFESGAIFSVTLDRGDFSAVAGTDYDQVAVLGRTRLGGVSLDLALTPNFEATATPGVVFTILSSDGFLGSTSHGASTTVTLNSTHYRFGIDHSGAALLLTLQSISPVPEPAAAGALAGFLGLAHALLRRRRRS